MTDRASIETRIALVTGANKGIGKRNWKEISRQLSTKVLTC